MSGIIGRAGSRSGVIGTTEIDYEEGTYTPYFQVSGSNISGGSYTTQLGSYTKIGNIAHVFIDILLSAEGISSGAIQVSLPFAQAGTYPAPATIGYSSGFSNADSPNAGYVAPSTAYIELIRGNSDDGRSMLKNGVGGDVITATGAVKIQITLKTS